MVNFSAGVIDGVEAALGEDVDPSFAEAPADRVALADGEPDGIGTTLLGGWKCRACDLNFPLPVPPCGEPIGASGDPSGTGGLIPVEGTVSRAIGEVEAVGCGDGVTLGTSNLPRRCDAVGEADAAVLGIEVVAAVAFGVALGAAVGVADTDVVEVDSP